jgi:hypothetical protein
MTNFEDESEKIREFEESQRFENLREKNTTIRKSLIQKQIIPILFTTMVQKPIP